MADETDTQPTTGDEGSAAERKVPVKLVAWVGSLLIVALATWAWSTSQPNKPYVIEGFAEPNGDGTAIALYDSPTKAGPSSYQLIIAGASFKSSDASAWRDGATSPTCIGTDTDAAVPVKLGVLDVGGTAADNGLNVIWIECVDVEDISIAE